MTTPDPHPDPDRPRPATRAITAGRAASAPALAPALWATTTWESSDLDDANRRATAMRGDEFYSRYANPTVRSFEQVVAELEGAEDALSFASGMGAIASVVLALCSTGDHVVTTRQAYAGTTAFLQGPCARLGIETTIVDGTDGEAIEAAIRPGRTMVVLVESPSNPRLEVVDLARLGAIVGPFTVVDSTLATPLGQRPLDHGVDLVLHSATKGIAGHNDATLGVIAGERELLDTIWSYGVLHGATASPFDALNGLRGARTLGVRFAQQCASATRLARWADEHAAVRAVHFPGLASHPQRALVERQMSAPGTVLSIELVGGVDAARRLLARVELCRRATSLGGPETLVCHPATSTHVSLTHDEQAAAGVTPGLVRISVGLEDPDDLVADLDRALGG